MKKEVKTEAEKLEKLDLGEILYQLRLNRAGLKILSEIDIETPEYAHHELLQFSYMRSDAIDSIGNNLESIIGELVKAGVKDYDVVERGIKAPSESEVTA